MRRSSGAETGQRCSLHAVVTNLVPGSFCKCVNQQCWMILFVRHSGSLSASHLIIIFKWYANELILAHLAVVIFACLLKQWTKQYLKAVVLCIKWIVYQTHIHCLRMPSWWVSFWVWFLSRFIFSCLCCLGLARSLGIDFRLIAGFLLCDSDYCSECYK